MITRLRNWWRNRGIPQTLDEAVDQILGTMTADDMSRYCQEDPRCPGIRFHFGGATAMRNQWGLWDESSPLSQWFTAHGISHADDRSACVFKALYCRLTGKPFDIAAEAAYYRDFWTKSAKVQNGASFGVKLHKDGRVEIEPDEEAS